MDAELCAVCQEPVDGINSNDSSHAASLKQVPPAGNSCSCHGVNKQQRKKLQKSVTELVCGHRFHLECVINTFISRGAAFGMGIRMECPLCRNVEENSTWPNLALADSHRNLRHGRSPAVSDVDIRRQQLQSDAGSPTDTDSLVDRFQRMRQLQDESVLLIESAVENLSHILELTGC